MRENGHVNPFCSNRLKPALGCGAGVRQAIAKRFGATLRCCTSSTTATVRRSRPRSTYPNSRAAGRAEADAVARLKDRLQASDVRELRATTAAVIGMPSSSIVDYARFHDIDLIIMGTHGRGGMSHLLMGSVAERVVRTAPCPVLTVRETPATAKVKTTSEVAVEVPPALMTTSTVDGQC